jgi:hypothetical protein
MNMPDPVQRKSIIENIIEPTKRMSINSEKPKSAAATPALGENGVPVSDDPIEIIDYILPESIYAIPTDILNSTKQALDKAMESILNDKKGSKSKTVDHSTVVKVQITETICRKSLPIDIIRMCILATINSDTLCIRRGYIMDAWDWAIQNVSDIRQVMNVITDDSSKAQILSRPSTSDVTSKVEVQSPSPKKIQDKSSFPNLLVELQV